MEIPLMSIRIGMDPDMFEIGSFVLTWHGFFTFIAVALAVFLVGRWAKKEGLDADAVYSVAVWAIVGGIIGDEGGTCHRPLERSLPARPRQDI